MTKGYGSQLLNRFTAVSLMWYERGIISNILYEYMDFWQPHQSKHYPDNTLLIMNESFLQTDHP